MSLAKLTSVSTQTLSLLLERQRLQTLPSFASSEPPTRSSSMHIPQITKNLTQLRAGILELEANEGRTEAVGLLRNQFERMRSMLGREANVERFLTAPIPLPPAPFPHMSNHSLDAEDESLLSSGSTPNSSMTPRPLAASILHDEVTREASSNELLIKSSKDFASSAVYTPYTDDPQEEPDPNVMLQTQRQMMEEQDEHLDRLSHSIGRQHHISLQINDELDVHAGLLEELDTDLDRTGNRLGSARRRLDKFARGAKENGSTVTIALLILVLLILIIIFKT
ncbi:hypothetical protein AX17_004318 [Amanita inopinata Kibby_2008]|nr:hypothetical protein AX17_004318 [Amanita inopinata Kibby_2008]